MDDKSVKSNQQYTFGERSATGWSNENEGSLEHHLWNISQATDGGRIRGHVIGCELAQNDTIRIRVQLPNNESHTQTFPMPKTNSPEYAFVRFIKDCGYSLSSVGQLAGDDSTNGTRVWCKPVDTSEYLSDPGSSDGEADIDRHKSNDWQLVIPEFTPSLRERLHTRLKTLDSWKVVTTLAVGGGFLLLPLLFPIIIFRLLNDDSSETVMTLIVGALALVAWTSGMWLLYITVLAPAVDVSAII